mgnify:CR=1 FL=1
MLTFSKKASLAKNQVEQIQKKKTEYKLLGSYRRSKGLKLFSYNVITKEVLDWFDPESSRTNIDSRNIHFEALNLRTATERVRKFQQGKIKDLFNLKPKANSKLIF